MEGMTGYDTEFAVAGEPVPQPIFGYAPPTHNGQPLVASAAGHIKGAVVGIKTYTPPKGGAFDFWGGNTGTKVNGPIATPWLSLADLQNGDQAVWVGQGDANGNFEAGGVQLDLHRRRALTAQGPVSLTGREFALLAHLMRRSNDVCSREELLHDIWDLSFDPGSNVVDVCVRRLRSKLQPTPPIETVRGAGYCFYDE